MKNFAIIVFLITYSFNAIAQKSAEAEILINKVTDALKLQNEDSIVKCVPKKEEFQKLIEITRKHNPDIELPPLDEIQKSIIKETKSTFRATIDSGRINGINWDSLRLIDFRVESEENEFVEIEKGDIYINYTDGKTLFRVKLVDCIKVDSQWKLMDRIWWYGKVQ